MVEEKITTLFNVVLNVCKKSILNYYNGGR